MKWTTPTSSARAATGAAGGGQQPGAQRLQLHRRRAHRRACAQRPGGGARHRHRHVRRGAVAGVRAVLPRRAQPPAGHRPGPVDRASPVRPLRLEGQPGQRAGAGHRGDGHFPVEGFGRAAPGTRRGNINIKSGHSEEGRGGVGVAGTP
ncbi:hypothetical protein G6F40_015914 [Rhizopus arrhizus]|nr:hypothetical protein G6F40_015914 [Rhizopus arrhizus]